jgi:SNF2 family DNA or RNA helicase
MTKVANVLIGDDMGLGKTVEAVLLDKIKRQQTPAAKKRTLVVAPLSVLDVWREHFAEWAPELTVAVLDPKDRNDLFKQNVDVYIVHWDSLRLMPGLNKRQWFHVIADEAHRAKNRKAQMTQALKRIRADNKTACTGTPAEDKPHDIWSILNWLWPKKYTSYWRFYNEHILWDTHPKGGYRIVKGVKNVPQFLNDIKPFYIRRMKDQVLPELPDKQYTEYHIQLSPKQRKAYNDMKSKMLAWVGENEDKPLAAPVAISRLMRLQQFALTHMDLVDGFKTQHYNEADVRVAARQGNMIEVGQPYKVPIKVYRMVEPSSKLDTLMQIIEDNPNESIVVFSQFKQVINLLAERLVRSEISHGVYTGDTPKPIRDAIVRDFQLGTIRIFAGTIRAGGEGITLTRARTMVFTDRDWSPSKNRQAEDRCHRVGQKNAVHIIDLVATNTVDRGRLQQIALKWKTIRQLLGEI